MASRPVVTIYNSQTGAKATSTTLPAVFRAPIRTDVVTFVHDQMRKNHRQPYAVFNKAGHQHSAESWGTGRAVARIPRVSGGGTSRSGQGAFGNMCRKGRMFAPTKVWRKWNRRINQNQRRFATVSALAASALPALVEARGHRISHLPQVPLVVDSGIEKVKNTKGALALFKALGAQAELDKCVETRKIRAGVGKMRNRRHIIRRGPLVVVTHSAKKAGAAKAFRNIPGVEVASVRALNLLQLAPGGHVGRFVIWSEGAFKALDHVFGTFRAESRQKHGYKLPQPILANADIARIINSNEIQKVVKPAQKTPFVPRQKKNPLKNFGVMLKLNPYAAVQKRAAVLAVKAQRERIVRHNAKRGVKSGKAAAAAPKKDAKKDTKKPAAAAVPAKKEGKK